MAVKINYKKCTACKRCYEFCPMDVFTLQSKMNNMPQVTYEEECWHCGICWMECPERAIELEYPPSFW